MHLPADIACEVDKTFIEVKNIQEDMQRRQMKHSRSKSSIAEFSPRLEHMKDPLTTPPDIYSLMSSTSKDYCPWIHAINAEEFMWTQVFNTFQELGFTNPDMMQEMMENIPDWPRENGTVSAESELVVGNQHHKELMNQAVRKFRIHQRAEQVMGIVRRYLPGLSDKDLTEVSPELQNLRAEMDYFPELKPVIEKSITTEIYLSFLRENPVKMYGILRTITMEDNLQLINHSTETMNEAIKLFQEMNAEWLRYQDLGGTFSKGSLNHPHNCSPCMFYMYSAKGCREGFDCEYCHCEHISNRAQKREDFKEQRKEKKRAKAAERALQNMQCSTSSSCSTSS
jgi:hypothetical protein